MENSEADHADAEAPKTIAEPTSHQTDWLSSLRFKLGIGLFGLFLLLVVLNLWFIWSKGLPLLIQQNKEFNAQIGENLVASLDQQLKQAEALAKDMANIAEVLPNEDHLYLKLIPSLLDMESMQSLVAGGGIWPEPFQFNPNNERNSFFWGRDKNGKLQFFDDYNDEKNKSYHSEEWYVPTSLLANGGFYWSRSYTDPYSLQPMVTCSVPIFKGAGFSGVATVDLALDGVSNLLKSKFKAHPGYAFVVDRNNRFITFPNQSLVSNEHRDKQQQLHIDFLKIDELALIEPVFKPLAAKLVEINQRQAVTSSQSSSQLQHIAEKIALKSDQIAMKEAETIAHNMLLEDSEEIVPLANFKLSDDLLLRKEVDITVYQMPHTHWKVITVFPFEESIRVAMTISKTVTWISLCGILFWGIICTLFLRQILFSRLRDMTNRIRQSVQDGEEILLEQHQNDEIGILAQWYNYRTQQLQSALQTSKRNEIQLQRENENHKSTTRLLEKSLALQGAILDSAHLAILSLDGDGRIISTNAGTLKILGYEEHELVGKLFPNKLIDDSQLADFFSKSNITKHVDVTAFELLTGELDAEEHAQEEWIFNCKSGARIHGLLTITAVMDSNKCIDGWLAVITDFSGWKRA